MVYIYLLLSFWPTTKPEGEVRKSERKLERREKNQRKLVRFCLHHHTSACCCVDEQKVRHMD